MIDQLTRPTTPVTAFADLMDALTRMTALDTSIELATDHSTRGEALVAFSIQADRAVAAHSWLVLHEQALSDITDVLEFVYGDGGAA